MEETFVIRSRLPEPQADVRVVKGRGPELYAFAVGSIGEALLYAARDTVAKEGRSRREERKAGEVLRVEISQRSAACVCGEEEGERARDNGGGVAFSYRSIFASPSS